MEIRLRVPKIWLACEPVDFRKAIDGLSEVVSRDFNCPLEEHIYVFYNRARNKVKLLTHHRHGTILIYKRLAKKKFTFHQDASGRYGLTEQQLAWLLAGLNWVDMSSFTELSYTDYF